MPKPHLCPPALLAQDLHGKTYIVTGGNSGIGATTVEQLAKQGATVVLACRRVQEGEAVRARIREQVQGASIDVRALDLADLDSVRRFADEVLAAYPRIDVLINNAGVMNTPQGKTKQGFETQIGVNHFGHYLLTELLLERLKASAPSRIVNVSSCYHDIAMGREGHIDFDDLHFERRSYDGWSAYAQSKLANVLHAKALAKRLAGSGVAAVSLHPGWVRTNLMRHSMPTWLQNTIALPLLRLFGMIEPWEGAQTTLYCALAPEVADQSGAFFSQLGLYRDKRLNRGGWPMQSPNPEVHDEALVDCFDALTRTTLGLGA